MNWTEPKPPTEGESYYDHVSIDTPLGVFYIEWKSWKDNPSYDVMLEDVWIGVGDTLVEAKNIVEQYLNRITKELVEFWNS